MKDKTLEDWEVKLESLRDATQKVNENIMIAYGQDSCMVCGHTPKILYREVEKLIKQAFQAGYNHALEEVYKWASDYHITSEKTSNTYWWTRGDEIGRGEVYKEAMRDILQLIKEMRV